MRPHFAFFILTSALLLPLAACAPKGYRYQPDPQPQWAHLYADYSELQGSINVIIDTDKRRLEDATIELPNNQIIHPTKITYPNFAQSASVGTGVGVGAGPVGVGVGTGVPIGPSEPQGPTIVNFDSAAIGPAPWTLHVKCAGINTATFRLGGPPNVK